MTASQQDHSFQINKYQIDQNFRGMPEIRPVVLQLISVAPRSFLELLGLTQANYSELTQTLESLVSEGLVGRSSDGFQTLYIAPKIQEKLA
jgi:hypothetical protein